MVKEEEKQERLKGLFEEYLKSGKEEDLFELFEKLKKELGRKFRIDIKRVEGEKFKISVGDAHNIYPVFSEYKPNKREKKAIINFALLGTALHGTELTNYFIDEIYTTKHSRDPERVRKEAKEIKERYEEYRKL
jgi:hypothetical protein